MVVNWYEIFVTSAFRCKYCEEAKELLKCYGMDFVERDIATDENALDEFKAHGFTRIPQVFREGVHIGGCDKLKEHLRLNHSPKAREEKDIEGKVKF